MYKSSFWIIVLLLGLPLGIAPLARGETAQRQAGGHVALVVNSALYFQIDGAIQQYRRTLSDAGYSSSVTRWSPTQTQPSALRQHLASQHRNNNLVGAFLIGELPKIKYRAAGSEAFLTDFYFMDLDGRWRTNNLGELVQHSGSVEPEIWVGRLRLIPQVGDFEDGGEAGLARHYLHKVERYRNGKLFSNGHGLEFVTKPWAKGSSADFELEALSQLPTQGMNTPESTTKKAYLAALRQNYELVYLIIHGTQKYHFFQGDQKTTIGEISKNPTRSLFFVLKSCSANKYDEPGGYLGGSYLSTRNGGLAVMGATHPFSSTIHQDFLSNLGKGMTLGEAFKDSVNVFLDKLRIGSADETLRSSLYGMILLGDPTLKLSQFMSTDLPIRSAFSWLTPATSETNMSK